MSLVLCVRKTCSVDAITPVTPVTCRLRPSLVVEYGLCPVPLTAVESMDFIVDGTVPAPVKKKPYTRQYGYSAQPGLSKYE
jgi:hypothetical protein